MSVILNALRSRKENAKNETKPARDNQSLHWGNNGTVYNRVPASKRSLVILLGVLLALIVGALGLWLYNHFINKTKSIPPALIAPNILPPELPPPEWNTIKEAKTNFAAGKLEIALDLYQRALKEQPKNAFILSDIGLVYLKKKEFKESENYFKDAVEVNKSCAPCWNNLGYLKSLQNKALESQLYLTKAVHLDATYADPHFNLGVLYERHGDIKNAIRSYQKFLHLFQNKNDSIYIRVQDHIRFLMVQ